MFSLLNHCYFIFEAWRLWKCLLDSNFGWCMHVHSDSRFLCSYIGSSHRPTIPRVLAPSNVTIRGLTEMLTLIHLILIKSIFTHVLVVYTRNPKGTTGILFSISPHPSGQPKREACDHQGLLTLINFPSLLNDVIISESFLYVLNFVQWSFMGKAEILSQYFSRCKCVWVIAAPISN